MKNMSAARALLVAAFAATPVLSAAIEIPQSPGHFTSIHQREVVEKCPGFNGNPDLYGLGIRLGVYSQWFSSWLTNTCNPSAAAANHDANSIFLLALLIGISVAVANDAIRPVEAYVMLHICFGFIFTVLSLLGVRVYFLTPQTLSEFLCQVRIKREKLRGSVRERIQAVQTALQHFQEWLRSRGEDEGEKEPQQQEEGRQDNRRASVASRTVIGRNTICRKLVRNLREMPDASLPSSTLGLVRASTIEFTSDAVSFLKHPSLSWSGVAWRSAVLTYLIGLNLWFWWSPWLIDKVSESTGGKACAPSIFFFGHQHITGSLLDFFRSVSVILAIPALWLCWIILSAAFAVWKFVLGFLARWLVITALERVSPGMWDKLYDGTKFVIGLCLTPFMLWDNIWPYVVIDGFLGSPVLLHGIYSFWTIGSGDLPGWSDLWKPFISFMSRGIDLSGGAARTPGGRLEEKKQASIPRSVIILCVTFHAASLGAMICFMVFIEKTITVAEISDVYSLRSTGQLIPFIIGLASFAASVREITLLHFRKRYPDWYTRSLTFKFSLGPSFCNHLQSLEKKEPTVAVDSEAGTPESMIQDPMDDVSPKKIAAAEVS